MRARRISLATWVLLGIAMFSLGSMIDNPEHRGEWAIVAFAVCVVIALLPDD